MGASPLSQYTKGWWVVFATLITLLPWGIVSVWDAIDSSYRSRRTVALRLLLSTFCLVVAYSVGLIFTIALSMDVMSSMKDGKSGGQEADSDNGRHDEIAAVLVLLVFNLWHVFRNLRGWFQFLALSRLRPMLVLVQRNFAESFQFNPDNNDSSMAATTNANDDDDEHTDEHDDEEDDHFEPHTDTNDDSDSSPTTDDSDFPASTRQNLRRQQRYKQQNQNLRQNNHHHNNRPARNTRGRRPHIAGFRNLLISNRLIDNDWSIGTPFLNPFTTLDAMRMLSDLRENWATALWRAFWTQDTRVIGSGPRFYRRIPTLRVPKHFKCDKHNRHTNVQDLLESEPSATKGPEGYISSKNVLVVDDVTKTVIKTKEQWANCLLSYSCVEGQQDTHGDHLDRLIDPTKPSALAILISEKRDRIPNRMTALWYDTVCFEDLYKRKARECYEWTDCGHVLFPSWSQWLHIAQDVAVHLDRPVYLSDTQLTCFAGELASASLILVRYKLKYRRLVRQIYNDGRDARWTFGWSGLLACFSHLWTEERIYMAMLNGLSLLALDSVEKVSTLDANVRSMLYGFAAFEVSDRAVGREIAEDRSRELLRRYLNNKGKTCRGSGVCATRMACRALGLPAEASHMDGLPAFSTGWASEYMDRLPGNQTPSHGGDHDEVEAKHGSSNAWRYPYSRS